MRICPFPSSFDHFYNLVGIVFKINGESEHFLLPPLPLLWTGLLLLPLASNSLNSTGQAMIVMLLLCSKLSKSFLSLQEKGPMESNYISFLILWHGILLLMPLGHSALATLASCCSLDIPGMPWGLRAFILLYTTPLQQEQGSFSFFLQSPTQRGILIAYLNHKPHSLEFAIFLSLFCLSL